MKFNRFFFTTFCLLPAVCVLSGCSPTYPTQKDMIEGVIRLCKNEYGIDVKAKVADSTLGVYMPVAGLFNMKNMQISKKAIDKIDGVMLSVSRVALSGSKKIDFYTVVTADQDVSGAEVAITRYVTDLRRYYFHDISRGEFNNRMVVDIRFNMQAIIDKLKGEFTIEPVKMENFICQQAGRRIQDEFNADKTLSGRFKISEFAGELKNRNFVFSMNIEREGLPMSELIHGKKWHEGVLLLCARTISNLVRIYDFNNFDKIVITNKYDNKTLEISQKDINKHRNRRIKIE
ncbi:MAG: hypothetical protein JW946_03840 [Candidatus Omnitrophica bacterium]|nr:hypothetical protein [Candidatus Omnitrophota bacterium]